jgi:molybdopterin-guanine dinucleotide biosynthesis protein B
VGQSDTGKTRLMLQLIAELKARGRSVGAIKHCPSGFSLEVEGKDSWHFAQAGADWVAVTSPDQVAVLRNTPDQVDARSLAQRHFPDVDVVLVEGARQDKGLRKIEVLRKGIAEELQTPPDELTAVVADVEVATDKPVYRPDEIRELADFLDQGAEDTVSGVLLSVDGTPVPLNPFVRAVFGNVVSGMVASLKGVAQAPKHITLTVARKEAAHEGR